MLRRFNFSHYSLVYIIAVFIFSYLHRRLDMFSSALIMIGALLFYIPTVVFHVSKMVRGNQPVAEGLLAIYAVGLFLTAATFFVLGKDHFAQAGEPIAAVSLLTTAFVVWRLYRREKMNSAKRSNRDMVSRAIPALIAVLMFVVLNYR